MGSAIQITVVRGRPGLRSSMSFLLGDYGRFHRLEVNRILEQNTLTFIEGPDVEGAMEIDGPMLKTALHEKTAEIDEIEDDELRVPFQRLRDYYLSLPDGEAAFALADIVHGS
ncbi:MAG: hypothetical protein DI537_10620 [Stutzerimonas stutzeri]|nr:MAG: hypothetical protein DI537_10620 [Stutzerimonas stutzeri]